MSKLVSPKIPPFEGSSGVLATRVLVMSWLLPPSLASLNWCSGFPCSEQWSRPPCKVSDGFRSVSFLCSVEEMEAFLCLVPTKTQELLIAAPVCCSDP